MSVIAAAHRLVSVLLLSSILASGAADPLRAIFEQAVNALSSGDLTRAGEGFQQVLERSPNHLGALANLGVVYSRANRTAEAVKIYNRALKLAPDNPGLLLNLGLAYLKQEDYARARPLFARVVSVDSGHRQARELLATTRLYTDEVDLAVAELEGLRKTEPADSGILYFLSIGYLKQGQREKARHTMDEMFRKALNPAQANFLQGKAFYESTLFENAERAFTKARTLDPELPGVHLELGKTYVSLRKSEEAERSLMLALDQNPYDPEANYFLGALLAQGEKPERGLPYLEKALAAKPDFWGAYYYMGKAKLQMDAAAAALPLLEKAAQLNPEESSVYYQLARALKAAGRDAEARQAADKVTALKRKALKEGQEALVIR
ncbi:MAG: tetratricopeptide repeat protein [Bryobacteraceae bacterium]